MAEMSTARRWAFLGATGLIVLGLQAASMMPVQASEAELCIKARMWEKISRPDATQVCGCISQTINSTNVSDDESSIFCGPM